MNTFIDDYLGVYIEVAGIAVICISIAIYMRRDAPPAAEPPKDTSRTAPKTVTYCKEIESEEVPEVSEGGSHQQSASEDDGRHFRPRRGSSDIRVSVNSDTGGLAGILEDIDEENEAAEVGPPRSLCKMLQSPVIIAAIISEMVGM